MLDLVKLWHLPYITVDKWCAIVTDDPMRHPKSYNYILLDEVCLLLLLWFYGLVLPLPT